MSKNQGIEARVSSITISSNDPVGTLCFQSFHCALLGLEDLVPK